MAGAPQGLIFDVAVLETGDVPLSEDIAEDIEVGVWSSFRDGWVGAGWVPQRPGGPPGRHD